MDGRITTPVPSPLLGAGGAVGSSSKCPLPVGKPPAPVGSRKTDHYRPDCWVCWAKATGGGEAAATALGGEEVAGGALEKEMATHSSLLAWRIPWTEKPGRLQSMGSHRVGSSH